MKKKADEKVVELDEKDWMPSAALEFFENENFKEIVENLSHLDNSVTLVGPFRKLRGESDADGTDLIMLDREMTDLPEMQTFMKCSHGRYAFWRDKPNDKKPVIVFMDLKTIPDLSVVGNEIRHAILDFCTRCSKCIDCSAKSKAANSKIQSFFTPSKISSEVKEVLKHREKTTVRGISGPGMLIDVVPTGNSGKKNKKNERTGYRDLSKNAYCINIEHLVRSLRLCQTKEQEEKVLDFVYGLMNEINICNDEGDFGNGLELGHILFLANMKAVADPMMITLHIAYKNLHRPDFAKILDLTLSLRDQQEEAT